MFHHLLLIALAVVLTACATSDTNRVDVPDEIPADATAPGALSVMTFNIRYGTARDGANHWDKRKELCAARVRHFDPDVLGLQESLAFQNDYLRAHCPGYTFIGVGRDDGKQSGEFSTLLVRTARFTVVDSGTFWLSTTPETAGSKSWDSSLPRIVTWARVQDRKAGDRPLLLVNTHFDSRGPESRKESAKIIRAFIATHAADAAVIVTGDFNSAPSSDVYRTLTDMGNDGVLLGDAYADLHRTNPEMNEGTAHGFKGMSMAPRIDWILHSPAFSAKSAVIDRYREGSLFPSDHFAVAAVLSWK